MTTRKKTTTGKTKVKELMRKKKTIKDLDAKGKARDVKAGAWYDIVGPGVGRKS